MSSAHVAIRQTDPNCFEILPPDGAVSEGQPEAICVWHVADAVKVRFSGAQPHQPPMGRAGVACGLRPWSDQVVECRMLAACRTEPSRLSFPTTLHLDRRRTPGAQERMALCNVVIDGPPLLSMMHCPHALTSQPRNRMFTPPADRGCAWSWWAPVQATGDSLAIAPNTRHHAACISTPSLLLGLWRDARSVFGDMSSRRWPQAIINGNTVAGHRDELSEPIIPSPWSRQDNKRLLAARRPLGYRTMKVQLRHYHHYYHLQSLTLLHHQISP